MVVKYGRYGKFLACPGFPDCHNIKPFVEKVDVPCPVCGAEVYVRKTKRGKNYFICANNEGEGKGCNYISWNKPKLGEEWTPEIEKELNSEKSKKAYARKKARKTAKATKKTATKKATAKKTTTKTTTTKTTKKSTKK